MPIELLCVVGMGHCGSTLLDLILGGHRSMVSVGEIVNLDDWLSNNKRCGCRAPLGDCPFWHDVMSRWEHIAGRGNNGRHWPATEIRRGAGNSPIQRLQWLASYAAFSYGGKAFASRWLRLLNGEVAIRAQAVHGLFDAARSVNQSEVLVDSSKLAYRAMALHALRPTTTRILHLSRDARAWFRSYGRRHQTRYGRMLTAREGARIWRRAQRVRKLLESALPEAHLRHVLYEQICREPEATIRQICVYLDIDFDPAMLKFRERTNHNIGGNPMRLRADSAIVEDIRWREEVAGDEAKGFEAMIGDENRRILGSYYVA